MRIEIDGEPFAAKVEGLRFVCDEDGRGTRLEFALVPQSDSAAGAILHWIRTCRRPGFILHAESIEWELAGRCFCVGIGPGVRGRMETYGPIAFNGEESVAAVFDAVRRILKKAPLTV